MNQNNSFFHEIKCVNEHGNGRNFAIRLAISMAYGWIQNVKFLYGTNAFQKSVDMTYSGKDGEYVFFTALLFLENRAKEYNYCFYFEANDQTFFAKRFDEENYHEFFVQDCWKLYSGFNVPDWAKGAIMYHIFVDRYRRGETKPPEVLEKRKIHESWYDSPTITQDESGRWNIDFYGGDLKGIEETLKYIKKLGVSIIYLSPICMSQSTHRYDTSDYEKVDPYLGTEETIISLCNSAHEKGMRVILDVVFNHTGNDSKYFNEFGSFDTIGAFQSKDSPYYAFYKKKDDGSFAYWWDFETLPVCDKDSPLWQMYILAEGGIIDRYFSWGVDGLRLDVADELSDEFIHGINLAAKRNKQDALILGEVWEYAMAPREYISRGDGMHSIMNYYYIDALLRYFKYCDVSKLTNITNSIFSQYPGDTILTCMNFTSTHDISRLIELLACEEFNSKVWYWDLPENTTREWERDHQLTSSQYKRGKQILKAYIFSLYYFPGIVSIFYGDEIGLRGIGNLINRSPYPWQKRDKSLLRFFRKMGHIRKTEKFLRTAETRIVEVTDEHFAFERYDENNSILVIVSRVDYETQITVPEKYKNAYIHAKIGDCTSTRLSPYGAVALKRNGT